MRRMYPLALAALMGLSLAACSSSPSHSHANTYQRATPAMSANGGLAVGDSVGAVAFQQPSDSRVASVLINED